MALNYQASEADRKRVVSFLEDSHVAGFYSENNVKLHRCELPRDGSVMYQLAVRAGRRIYSEFFRMELLDYKGFVQVSNLSGYIGLYKCVFSNFQEFALFDLINDKRLGRRFVCDVNQRSKVAVINDDFVVYGYYVMGRGFPRDEVLCMDMIQGAIYALFDVKPLDAKLVGIIIQFLRDVELLFDPASLSFDASAKKMFKVWFLRKFDVVLQMVLDAAYIYQIDA